MSILRSDAPLWRRLRRRVTVGVVDGFFVYVAAASRLQPIVQAHRYGIEVTRDVPYIPSGDKARSLDIYRPAHEQTAPWPVVMYVHGGGFRILSKESHWLMALTFARRGYLVFNVDYRRAPEHKFPAALEDVSAAYRFVARNAAAFGGDPSRLVLAGESAGANLVTSLAVSTSFARPEPFARQTFATDVRPRAVVAACGILQVSDPERLVRAANVSPYYADYLAHVRDAYLPAEPEPGQSLELADPLLLLESGVAPERPLPPFFAMAGTRDPLADDTLRLEAALTRRGVLVDARFYKGEGHAFHAFTWRKKARLAWRDTFAFLDDRLGRPAASEGRLPHLDSAAGG